MTKPKVKNRTYLDWQDIQPWLQKQGVKTDQILRDLDVQGNGTFESVELFEGEDEDQYISPAVKKMTELLFREFPKAVKRGSIDIWVWW